MARYQIVRGKRPPGSHFPEGIRIDIRKHTHHVLSPSAEAVVEFLSDPSIAAFRQFSAEYHRLLEGRLRERREEFDELADTAARADVYVGCNCPTKTNPDVSHCHTVLALHFMKKKYPKLRVVLPASTRSTAAPGADRRVAPSFRKDVTGTIASHGPSLRGRAG
jgi:hypothetical protein